MQIFIDFPSTAFELVRRAAEAWLHWHASAEQEESQKKQDMHTSKYLERIYTAYSENGSLVSTHRRFCEKTPFRSRLTHQEGYPSEVQQVEIYECV
jgi:hypothetical protein